MKSFKVKTIAIISLLLIGLPAISHADSLTSGFWDQFNAFGETSKYQTGNRTTSPEQIAGQIIEFLLSFLGVIFLVLLVYAGFLWMTAQGESDQIDKAKNIMKNALVGIIIVLSSYIITSAILTNIGNAVSSGGSTGGSEILW